MSKAKKNNDKRPADKRVGPTPSFDGPMLGPCGQIGSSRIEREIDHDRIQRTRNLMGERPCLCGKAVCRDRKKCIKKEWTRFLGTTGELESLVA